MSALFFWYFSDLEASNPSWFQALTGHLSNEQRKELQTIMTTANQRKAAQGILSYLTAV